MSPLLLEFLGAAAATVAAGIILVMAGFVFRFARGSRELDVAEVEHESKRGGTLEIDCTLDELGATDVPVVDATETDEFTGPKGAA